MVSILGNCGTPTDKRAYLVEDDAVLHVVGRRVAVRKLEGQAVSFVHELPASTKQLTAMILSANSKYMALCEQATLDGRRQGSRLRVVHLQSKREVASLSPGGFAVEGAFVGCAFSADATHVVAWTGEPDFVAIVWKWSDETPLGYVQMRALPTRVRFNPSASTLLSVTSPIRLLRLNDKGQFKEIEVGALKRHTSNATDHLWVSATRLVLAGQASDGSTSVFSVFQDGSLLQSLKVPQAEPLVLSGFSAGFMAGCADGRVLLFQLERGEYMLTCRFSPSTACGPVRSLHVGPSERTVLVCCDEICSVPLAELLTPGLELEHGIATTAQYRPLLSSAHRGPIVGLACAASLPLLVSVGADQTVRAWDFRNLACRLVHQLHEPPLGLSLHPDGMHLVLAFREKLVLCARCTIEPEQPCVADPASRRAA
jgi:WD40 repeat protein